MQWKWEEKIRIQVSHLCSKDSSLKYVSCFMGGISGATHALSTNLPHKSSLYIFTCFAQRQTIKHARITWQPISSGISLCHPFGCCSVALAYTFSLSFGQIFCKVFESFLGKWQPSTRRGGGWRRGVNMPTVPILIRIFHPEKRFSAYCFVNRSKCAGDLIGIDSLSDWWIANSHFWLLSGGENFLCKSNMIRENIYYSSNTLSMHTQTN